MLASVHRSMPSPITGKYYLNNNDNDDDDDEDWRESDRIEWWEPRAKQIANFISNELSSSDVILLQEWWSSSNEFTKIFDQYTNHQFIRVSEQRPGGRPDGMATLINRYGKLQLLQSNRICTRPKTQRIAQIVQCREKTGNNKRNVIIANTHLSFPGGSCSIMNERRQAYEAHMVARAVAKMGKQLQCESNNNNNHCHLEIIGGDFNSNSCSLSSIALESNPYQYVNCMSASAQQALAACIGGRINIGVTHRNHLGENVSVDHIFTRLVQYNNNNNQNNNQNNANNNNNHNNINEALLRLGYFDTSGTRLINCRKRSICLEGDSIISDHRPVTATFDWPQSTSTSTSTTMAPDSLSLSSSSSSSFLRPGVYNNNNTLHFLQSPWDS